jgi:hypothetical protein
MSNVYTRVNLSVYKPTGFSVCAYVRTDNRWLAAKTVIAKMLKPGEDKYINDVHLTYRNPPADAVLLEPLDENALEGSGSLG